MSDYHTLGQVGRLLGVSRIWAWKLVRSKKLAATKVGHLWVVSTETLNRYIAAHKGKK